MSKPASTPDIVVTPKPTDEELAAIVAAVHVLLERDRQARITGSNSIQPGSGGSSRWSRTGRREAMAGLQERDRS